MFQGFDQVMPVNILLLDDSKVARMATRRIIAEAVPDAIVTDTGEIPRVFELPAQKAAVVVVPPSDPVQVSEKPSGLINQVAVPAAGAVEARLGEPVAAGANGGPAA